jgi:hypothetical protein
VTVSTADAAVVWRHGWRGYGVYRGTYGMHYRHARRVYRRAYRYGAYHGGSYYTQPDGLGGYPYSAGHYAYRHVWAPPVVVHRGWRWNRWGRGVGWRWGHRWGHGWGWGWHRGWRW